MKFFFAIIISIIFIRPSIPIVGIDIEYWVYLIILSLLIWNIKFYAKDLLFFITALPFLIYILFMFAYGEFNDRELVRRVIRSFVDVFICILVFKAIYKKIENLDEFLYSVFFYAALIQAFVMVGQYVFVGFKDLTTLIIYEDASPGVLARSSGFQNRGGDGLSFNQILGSFAGVYLYSVSRKMRFLSGVFFIAVSSLLTARSGFAVFAILMVIIGGINFLGFLFSLKIRTKTLKFGFIALVIIGASIPYIINKIDDVSRGYYDPIARAMEPIRNYKRYGEITTGSTQRLFGDFLIIPDEISRFVFGNGQYGLEGSEKIRSDIGYIRTIFGSGLIGLLLSLIPFLIFLIIVLKKSNYFFIMIVIFGILSHYKLMYLYTGSFLVFLTMTYLLTVYSGYDKGTGLKKIINFSEG